MFLILRLEKLYPAVLNEQMRQDILQGMFEEWLKIEVTKYGNYLDLSSIAKSDFVIDQPELETDADIDIQDDDESLPAIPIESNISPAQDTWRSLQLATVSFLCLLTGAWGGFQFSNWFNSPTNVLAEDTQNDPFYDAINQATKAANLTQTAKSNQEWEEVSQSWINAIALLKSLPQNHPQFTLATQKVQEYENNLNYSRKNSQNQQNSFRLAVNHATEAANLTQTATSTQEWEKVIKHWQDAISLMKAVKPDHSQYFLAQEKTIEYQRNVNYAFSVVKKHYPNSYSMSKSN